MLGSQEPDFFTGGGGGGALAACELSVRPSVLLGQAMLLGAL